MMVAVRHISSAFYFEKLHAIWRGEKAHREKNMYISNQNNE